MREAELLTALSQSPYGLNLNMIEGRTAIRLPHVIGMGETLLEAALDAARKVLADKSTFPHMERVREALEDYDRHTSTLRL